MEEIDGNTQDSSEFPELAIPEDDEGLVAIPETSEGLGFGTEEDDGLGFSEEMTNSTAIPASKIAWTIPVEIIFDKNEKSGIDEALSKGKFSIIFDKEAAGSALKSNKRKNKGTSTLHICQVCNKEFKKKHQFIRHKLLHSSEKTHSCKECQKSFKHLWTLTKHIKLKHTCLTVPEASSQDKAESECTLLEEDEPKENVKSNSGGQIHVCTKCDKKFPYASHLELHLKIHDGIKDLTCPQTGCGKKFKSNSHLNDHIRGHNKGFICQICQEGYRSRSALQYHITKSHTQPPPSDQPKQCYCCDICGKVFGDKRAVNAHKLSHIARPDIPQVLNVKKSRGTAKLRINEADTPGDLTNFIIPFEKVGKTTWYHCTTCGRRFYSAPSIMSHIYATHNKDLTTVTMCEKEVTDY